MAHGDAPVLDLLALGAFVRSRRQALTLSMQELADLAGRGRSTIHRLEHGPATKAGAVELPNSCALATVLVALRARDEELAPLLGAGAWSEEVLRWRGLLRDPHPLLALGDLIAERRRESGMTRADLARRAGTNVYVLLRIEHGTSMPDRGEGRQPVQPETVAAVLEALSVGVEAAADVLDEELWNGEWKHQVLTALRSMPAPCGAEQ